MKTKALVLAALPGAFRGPRVPLDDGAEWEVDCTPEAKGHVFVRRGNGISPAQYTLKKGLVIKDAVSAEVILDEENGVKTSVTVRCIRA